MSPATDDTTDGSVDGPPDGSVDGPLDGRLEGPPDDPVDGPLVTVRYWASAREAAGCSQDQVHAASLADALAGVRRRHDDRPRFAQVLDICSLLVGSDPVGSRPAAEVRLRSGDVVEVLPPFAGG